MPHVIISTLLPLREYARAHKIATVIITLVCLGGGYWIYTKFTSTAGVTRYVLAQVERGTIIVSVTGTGQVSASSELDIKPQASGEIISVPVHNGQDVAAGTLIAAIDATQAQKSVRDAQANLESARISLEKLQQPADTLTLTQAQNASDGAQSDLTSAYDSAFNEISKTFLEIPTVITGVNSILFSYDRTLGGSSQQNIDFYANTIQQYDTSGRAQQYHDDAAAKYNEAKAAYDKAFAEYKSTSRTANTAAIESLLKDTYTMVQLTFDSVKNSSNLIQLYQDTYTAKNLPVNTTSNTQVASLSTYTSTTNSHLSNLSASVNTIATDKQKIIETGQSLQKIKDGTDALDLESAQLAVTQRQNALQDARDNLANYYVRAPFAGTIASLLVKTHDYAGSTAIAVLVTPNQVAQISLNEVDAAKIKVGDKTTLTFDAVPDLTIAGTVSEINPIGTVSQGVVTYSVKIAFGSQDDRIKPGMSVSAAIQTNIKQNVLVVPGSAVKTQGSTSYVMTFATPLTGDITSAQGLTSSIPPVQTPVVVGISDDTSTEIISGLNEGDQIVVRTLTGAAAATQAPSLLNSLGGNRATGGGSNPARALGR